MKYSILHISDIHKASDVDYESLVQSLRRDFDAYTTNEGIFAPSFVVVSGDLIQGAYTDDEIRQQYVEVELFLNSICELYLQGDKSRLIIVPGNHDVNRAATIVSMTQSTKEYVDCTKAYFSGSPFIRWSWKDCKFYEVTNTNVYSSRFNLFIEFYNRFFSGIRQFPDNPEEKAFLVINDDFKVCFSCFNSCNQLDHLCDIGRVSENALISVTKELFDCYNLGYLNVAIWHHHFYGSPLETNYIDRSFLNDLLGSNIHIGLFGHQHYTQVAEEYSDLLLQKDEKTQHLLLVSSGTLFGGKKELPINCRRQYNIIEIEKGNGFANVDINVREDINPRLDNKIPYWRAKPLYNANNKVHYQVLLKHLTDDARLLFIDRRCKESGDYKFACEEIKQLTHETQRDYSKIFKSYLKEVKDYEYVYNNIGDVITVEDAVLKIIAARETGNPEYIHQTKSDEAILRMNDSVVKSLLSSLH